MSRHVVRFHPDAVPPRPFSDPRGLDPLRACGLVSYRSRSWGFFRSSGLFPAATPLRPRQPVVPSRRFSSSEEVAASSGLSVLQRSVLSRGMLQPCGADALSSFSSSSWHSCKPGCSVSRVATEVAVLLEIAHPLVTFARGTVLARSPGGPPASSHRLPGISRSRRRQPS